MPNINGDNNNNNNNNINNNNNNNSKKIRMVTSENLDEANLNKFLKKELVMKHIQISLQNHNTDMDDQDNDAVSMSDIDDKMENIAALGKDDDSYEWKQERQYFKNG
ncbi:hypothetical protein ACTA71_006203 [Dictyostelium dimigraforme]